MSLLNSLRDDPGQTQARQISVLAEIRMSWSKSFPPKNRVAMSGILAHSNKVIIDG